MPDLARQIGERFKERSGQVVGQLTLRAECQDCMAANDQVNQVVRDAYAFEEEDDDYNRENGRVRGQLVILLALEVQFVEGTVRRHASCALGAYSSTGPCDYCAVMTDFPRSVRVERLHGSIDSLGAHHIAQGPTGLEGLEGEAGHQDQVLSI